ncbi:HNH endonuclease [Streptomyces clavifer]|uniref:HNH endonuclease n=1 Tax=Streptomyces clavifer TaxID=68188 RepID=UPI00371FDC6C
MLWPQAPQFDVEKVVEACRAWLTSEEAYDTVRKRLPELKAREKAYRVAGENGKLLSLLLAYRPAQRFDRHAKLLKDAYTTAFVQRAEGRKLYDAIRAAAVHGSCPLCGLQQVAQVDHHAPKADFPLLALTPLNLVPVCGPCNQGKSSKLATSVTEEAFHPYFEDLGPDRWLHAQIDTDERVAVFEVRPPAEWDEVKKRRIGHHFESHDLACRYREAAGSVVAKRRRRDAELLEQTKSPAEVRAHIRGDVDSHAAHDPNGYETALLRALAESTWYLGGGMKFLYA